MAIEFAMGYPARLPIRRRYGLFPAV